MKKGNTKDTKEDKEKSFARRDKLIANEKEAQALWESQNFNQSEVQAGKKKFMVTFPYPYMNGLMHMGHAYSITKAEFYIRFKRIKGFNVLFPFGLHCTGMPICAAAKNLKEELDKIGIEALRSKMEENDKLPLDKRPPFSQYEILSKQQVEDAEIPKFTDPVYWCHHFPGRAVEHLKKFGVNVDWRRSFITTDENPYYDSFIKWHFLKLKASDFIKYGKRPSIFCIKDNEICADHDRAEGEGVEPQEYTLIKMKALETPGPLEQFKDKKLFLVAATLRPETMYGQTNCFVLPDGEYGAYESKDGEIWVCSEHSARNMAFQELLKTNEKWEKLADIKGSDLLGLPLKAPLATFEKVYVLPMLSILMNKGTGIVTSVPSDSPDDLAVINEFQKKQPLREKYGIKDEMIMPFSPVSIIEIEGYSDLPAVKALEEFKVKSMNDKNQLKEAKDKVYKLGFNDGVLKVGSYKGQKVKDAKPLVKADLIASGEAAIYYEPESEVVSRTQDICVVALTFQWYLPYGDEPYKSSVKSHINSDDFNTFNANIKEAFNASVDWFKARGCSRAFGLGTQLPWDQQFVIESLSDSTIYMAYYTISHFLQGDLAGRKPGSLNITPDLLTEDVWNYIFLNADYNSETMKVPEADLKVMRESFRYWYPLDLRVSGKDLIRNHLTMCLYNHAVVWKDEKTDMLPRAFFCNGWVLVDGEKMSKSKGNVYTVEDICVKFGADASRIVLANSGDTLNDANVSLKEIDEAILKLSALEMWIKTNLSSLETFRTDAKEEAIAYHDKIFENELDKLISESTNLYDSLVLREVVKRVFFTLHDLREEYFLNTAGAGMRKDLLIKYVSVQLALLYPIAPHFSEITWNKLFIPSLKEEKANFPEYISHYTLPDVDKTKLNSALSEEYSFYNSVSREMRVFFDKLTTGKKKKMNAADVKTVSIIITDKYEDWQLQVLAYFKESKITHENQKTINWKGKIKELMEGQDKKKLTKAFEFGSHVISNYENFGEAAYNTKLAFDQKEVLEKTKSVLLRDLKTIENYNVGFDLSRSSVKKKLKKARMFK